VSLDKYTTAERAAMDEEGNRTRAALAAAEPKELWKLEHAPPTGETLNGATPPDQVKASTQQWIVPKTGLRVADLFHDIAKDVLLRHDLGDGIWAYVNGVWRPDRGKWLRYAVSARLGNATRPTHTNAVEHYLLGQTPIIEPHPVPELLNVTNGLLDWRTGQLHQHSPDIESTVQLNTRWNPDATCPVIETWLAQVLDKELLEPTHDGPGFIWEAIGYLCMSGNPLHKALLLLGTGRNGKGTLLRLVIALLGSHNVSTVDLHSLVNNRFSAAELLGKVANIAGDLDGSFLESTAKFKAITGGDRITAERKFGAPFDFSPFAVPVYSANKVFGTPDTTDGYMSRWLIIPFPNTFLGEEDRTLDTQLGQPNEIEGLLVRAVAGLRAVMARGNFSTPPPVKEAFARFANESDPVRGFLHDVSQAEPGRWTTRAQLWDVYQVWAEDNGQTKKLSRAHLYSRVEAAGWEPHMSMGIRGFTGRTITAQIVELTPNEKHLELVEEPTK
jgi:putative DNA primase/helicase